MNWNQRDWHVDDLFNEALANTLRTHSNWYGGVAAERLGPSLRVAAKATPRYRCLER